MTTIYQTDLSLRGVPHLVVTSEVICVYKDGVSRVVTALGTTTLDPLGRAETGVPRTHT